jgi:hypothetical protein
LPKIFKHARLLVAGAAAYSMSTLFSAMKPVLLTRSVEEAGFSESLAGLVVAMPFVGIALASLLTRFFVNHLTITQLSLVFGAMLVGGELVSALYFVNSDIRRRDRNEMGYRITRHGNHSGNVYLSFIAYTFTRT